MRVRIGTAALLALAMLAGCGGGTQWVKPGADETQMVRDRNECDAQARPLASSRRVLPTREAGGRTLETGRDVAPGSAMEELRRFEDCMKARGYQRK